LEERYKKLLTSIDDKPYLAAAASHKSSVSGPTGVKMNGPYEYEGPVYWYADTLHGGAFGFNTETGPGPQVPVKETILRMIPQDKLWPINDTWNYHCTKATEAFNKLDGFNESVESRFGKARDLDDYIMKAELTQYEAIRPMYEAFRANEPNTTGIVQWMLNSAWPSFYWQLYDYYQVPTSAYYGTKKANAPLQLVYNYKNHTVHAVNATGESVKNLKAKFQFLNTESKVLAEKTVSIDFAVSPSEVFELDPVKGVVFLSLQLMNDRDEIISSNFYWLSEKPDVFAWGKTTWAYTPMKSYADFKDLRTLPVHDIEMKYTNADDGNDVIVNVTLTNNNTIAFFSKLELTDKDNKIIRPVFWSDNYFSLLPGETRKFTCSLSKDLFADGTSLSLSGWNVKPQQVKLK
jgi:exo-1,4-beta-D-glucosaminidase